MLGHISARDIIWDLYGSTPKLLRHCQMSSCYFVLVTQALLKGQCDGRKPFKFCYDFTGCEIITIRVC